MALVSIDELMGRHFRIPCYQRGYRWGRLEIEALLNDLWDFATSDPKKTEFYCLQPIVLRQAKEEQETFELLDGQQRLTTIYLLLDYLEQTLEDDGYDQAKFSLSYESRSKSETYLQEGGFRVWDDVAKSNIDYFHIAQAYQYIKEWFEVSPRHKGAKSKLRTYLLADSGTEPNIRVIEYLIEDDSKPIDVFLRLNKGKIPLTDAELVKALFLQADKYKADTQCESYRPLIQANLDNIASEWYEISLGLMQEDKWAFVTTEKDDTPTRISLILRLIAEQMIVEKKVQFKNVAKIDDLKSLHPCYMIFASYIEQGKPSGAERIKRVRMLWERIVAVYQLISEWYDNHELYHYVGYLRHQGVLLEDLVGNAKAKGGADFVRWLKITIAETIKSLDLVKLCYENEDGKKGDHSAIHRLLLLHNVHLSIEAKAEQGRFPFSLYSNPKTKWSLEHIHPQSLDKPERLGACLAWVNLRLSKRVDEGLKALREQLENTIRQLGAEAKLAGNAPLSEAFTDKYNLNSATL